MKQKKGKLPKVKTELREHLKPKICPPKFCTNSNWLNFLPIFYQLNLLDFLPSKTDYIFLPN